jgi:transcriptional regulator with XRE-family HTH domain
MYAHPQHNAGDSVKILRREAGGWLRGMRESRGLSQRDLATLVGVDYYTFISQIEAGRGRIPPDRYEAWADALGMETSLFVRKMMRFYDPVTYGLLFPRELPVAANSV